MNHDIKKLLQQLHIYYFLQGTYRNLLVRLHQATLRRQYARYKGNGYRCNYCGSAYTTFAPWYPAAINSSAIANNKVIAGYGENIRCPNCLSTARERLLRALVPSHLQIDGKKILHLSPEKHFYRFIKDRATVITADYFPGFYKAVDPQVQFADATSLAFEDAAFDMVIANHIMEHIPADQTAMKEIYRVLRPGGTAVLQVPFSVSIPATIEAPDMNDPAKQSALFGQADHVRIYALHDYLTRLQKAGFTVEYIPYESLHDYYQYAIQTGEGFISIRKM